MFEQCSRFLSNSTDDIFQETPKTRRSDSTGGDRRSAKKQRRESSTSNSNRVGSVSPALNHASPPRKSASTLLDRPANIARPVSWSIFISLNGHCLIEATMVRISPFFFLNFVQLLLHLFLCFKTWVALFNVFKGVYARVFCSHTSLSFLSLWTERSLKLEVVTEWDKIHWYSIYSGIL